MWNFVKLPERASDVPNVRRAQGTHCSTESHAQEVREEAETGRSMARSVGCVALP